MNFKLLIISISLLTLSACGVKSGPKPPSGTAIPSIVETYKKKMVSNIEIKTKDSEESETQSETKSEEE